MHEKSDDIHSHPLERRSVMRAAAWSVPAVSLASASPAYAMSGNMGDVDLSWIREDEELGDVEEFGQSWDDPETIRPLSSSHIPGGRRIGPFVVSASKNVANLHITITVYVNFYVVVYGIYRGFGAHSLRQTLVNGPTIPNVSYSETESVVYNTATPPEPVGRTYETTSFFYLPTIPAGGSLTLNPRWVLTGLPPGTETRPSEMPPDETKPSWGVSVRVQQGDLFAYTENQTWITADSAIYT